MRNRTLATAVLALSLLPVHPAHQHRSVTVTLLAAGDIPTCSAKREPSRTGTATAAIIGANRGTVAALGARTTTMDGWPTTSSATARPGAGTSPAPGQPWATTTT